MMAVRHLEILLLAVSTLTLGGCGYATPSSHRTEEYTPMFAAADACDLAKVRAGVDHDRALLKANSWEGTTLLHEAVGHNCDELVGYLLGQGAAASARTSDGTTPLHMAARRGNIVIANLLLQHGASISARDSGESTPLDVARAWKQAEMVAFLSQRDA